MLPNYRQSHRFRGISLASTRLALVLAISLGLLLTGCRNDRVAVNPDDPQSPQYAYRLDELALLQMAADHIQELEMKKQYGQIYDEYTSPGFQQNVSRRRFLIMANCVETHLGGVEEFDRNDIGFYRETLKNRQDLPLDVLNRRVQRKRGAIEEQMVFVGDGFNFKLNSLYWISKDKQFLNCITETPRIEADSQPKPDVAPKQTDTPVAEEPADEPQPEADTPPETPVEETAEEPGPVQELNPTEAKKREPLQARPAGAGAVKDTRPAAPKTPDAAKPLPPTTEPAQPLPVSPMPEAGPVD